MNKKYFVVLSTGSYSDYSPEWYMGGREITQKEMDKKAVEIGDQVVEWYEGLQTIGTEYYSHKATEDGEYAFIDREFMERMRKWLESEGYEMIAETAEVNVEYSDIPTSKGKYKERDMEDN